MKACELRRWKSKWRRSDGSVAIEFAFAAPIILLIIFGIIEFALVMFVSSVVEGATANAARLARTGAERSMSGNAAQRAAADSAWIRSSILQRGSGILQSGNLRVLAIPQGVGSTPGTMGGSGEMVMYQVSYDWQIMTPLVGRLIAGEDGVFTISSVSVVVNEPFDEDP